MILVEAKFYPFVLMNFRGESHSRTDYQAMFDATAAIARKALREHTRHVTISLGGASMNAAERKMVAREMDKVPRELLDTLIASYVVVDRPVVYGMLTALRWLTPKLSMIEPVPSAEAGMDAAIAAFEKKGIEVTPAQTMGARHWLRAQATLLRQASPDVA